ncbi:hypothetical protein Tco_0829963 [Tanacetum coccineum]
MHNNIMAAGLRDRPPMLATGRYAQWQSRFMRYVDTKPNDDALRKCILEGLYKISTVTIPSQHAIDDSPAVEKQTVLETLSNMSSENKAHYDAEKEAIHLILTGIKVEFYSTVDACKTAHEMWIAIERLQQVSSTTSTRMVKICNCSKANHYLDKESYHKFFDILKQYQKEVDEIRAEKIARNANPLALVAATQ